MSALVAVEAGTPVRACTHFDLAGQVQCDARATVVLRLHDPRYGTSETYRCPAHPAGRDADELLSDRARFPGARVEMERLP